MKNDRQVIIQETLSILEQGFYVKDDRTVSLKLTSMTLEPAHAATSESVFGRRSRCHLYRLAVRSGSDPIGFAIRKLITVKN